MKKLAAALIGAVSYAAMAHAQDAVIQAGHVLAVPGEGYLTNQTILVEDGRIVSITPGFTTPKKYPVIDLKKAYVLPGLIDSHVHITSENGPEGRIKEFEDSDVDAAFDGAAFALKTLKAGFTTVQDVGGANDAVFGLRDAIARGAVPGPRLRASGDSVAITGGHGDINGYSARVMAAFTSSSVCNGADDCRRAVRQQIKEGADLIKITATGGVLSNTAAGLEKQFSDEELKAIVEAAHAMGRKVTVDSASMMNKALELVEAHWLFGLAADRLEAIVHPSSVVHSFVEFVDGSVLAQLSPPDMRTPIQYALTYPARASAPVPRMDWKTARTWEFGPPDLDRFPLLALLSQS
jgi:imidazolonepropionase-like amidohydrolase